MRYITITVSFTSFFSGQLHMCLRRTEAFHRPKSKRCCSRTQGYATPARPYSSHGGIWEGRVCEVNWPAINRAALLEYTFEVKRDIYYYRIKEIP